VTAANLYALVGAALIAVALAAFVLHAHLLKKLLAFNVLGGGIFLMLVGLSPRSASATADPVAQALVLTGIVVAVAATALGLTMMRRLHAATGRADLDRQSGADD
jgi:multicomponent Na+:H+ antiporter subunit C